MLLSIPTDTVFAVDGDIPVSCNVTFQSVPYTVLQTKVTPTLYLKVGPHFFVSTVASNLTKPRATKIVLDLVRGLGLDIEFESRSKSSCFKMVVI